MTCDVVPAAPDRDLEIERSGQLDGIAYVSNTSAACNQRGTLVDESIVNAPRFLVFRVGRLKQSAGEPRGQLRDGGCVYGHGCAPSPKKAEILAPTLTRWAESYDSLATEVHKMFWITKVARVLSLLMIIALTIAAERALSAQQAAAPATTPEGYVPRGTRPGKGLAPGMTVTDLGKSARTYRVRMAKGDEIMSGLTDFAEKYKIKNAHFTALGAINKGLFGWTDVESGLGQKKIELSQEAEIVSLMGSISVDSQGRSNVHGHGTVALSDGSVKGGHWWEAHVSIIAEIFVTEEEGAPEPVKK